ncbi:MAG: hypothetical protein AAFP69_14220, partial [Planctomycetota bacterium]
MADLLRISPQTVIMPVIHGSGQFAVEVRRMILEQSFDCIAVPLPPSFQQTVEEAILQLPEPGIVVQSPSEYGRQQMGQWTKSEWQPTTGEGPFPSEESADAEDEAPDQLPHSYVPIDPCQPVIMAIRAGVGEHIRREYIDLETDEFLPSAATMPDPYALRHVSLQRFAAALLTMIPPPSDLQTRRRVLHMAARLVQLEHDLAAAKPGDDPPKILFVCSVLHWPWVRHAYNQLKQQADVVNGPAQHDSSTSMVRLDKTTRPEQQGGRDASGRRVFPLPLPDDVQPPRSFPVNDRTLMFLFGELPSITGLFERARAELEDDENLSVDGVKELLVTARDAYYEDLGRRARRVTPLLLSQCLKYIRNLSLISG